MITIAWRTLRIPMAHYVAFPSLSFRSKFTIFWDSPVFEGGLCFVLVFLTTRKMERKRSSTTGRPPSPQSQVEWIQVAQLSMGHESILSNTLPIGFLCSFAPEAFFLLTFVVFRLFFESPIDDCILHII